MLSSLLVVIFVGATVLALYVINRLHLTEEFKIVIVALTSWPVVAALAILWLWSPLGDAWKQLEPRILGALPQTSNVKVGLAGAFIEWRGVSEEARASAGAAEAVVRGVTESASETAIVKRLTTFMTVTQLPPAYYLLKKMCDRTDSVATESPYDNVHELIALADPAGKVPVTNILMEPQIAQRAVARLHTAGYTEPKGTGFGLSEEGKRACALALIRK